MHLSRRIAALLAVALLAGAPAVAHAQGSAGDDQYQDPFGGSTSGGKKSGGTKSSGSGSSSTGSSSTGSSGTTGTTGSSGSTSSGTTSAPATSSSTTGSSSSSGTAAAPAAASSGSRQELPRTGLDAPVIALLGHRPAGRRRRPVPEAAHGRWPPLSAPRSSAPRGRRTPRASARARRELQPGRRRAALRRARRRQDDVRARRAAARWASPGPVTSPTFTIGTPLRGRPHPGLAPRPVPARPALDDEDPALLDD